MPPAEETGLGSVRLAACQILVDGDRDAAFERIDRAMGEAVAQGAQVACFPEACLFGWLNPIAYRLADAIPGPSTERLGQLARRHQLMIAVGMAERDGVHLHNAVVLIGKDGSLLAHHRKINIMEGLMEPDYTAGQAASSSYADTEFGRIGLLICADTFDDSIVLQLGAARPGIVLVPYGWAAPAEDWPEHGRSLHSWISHTALRVQAPVLGVDSAGTLTHGPWKGYVLGGQSAFSDSAGARSTPMADRKPEVRVFDASLARSPEMGSHDPEM